MAALAFVLAGASASGAERWRDVTDLEQALDARDSATETLHLWCADHRRNADDSIHAVREPMKKPPSSEVLRRLGTADVTAIRYRRVRLVCGGATLSVADNWYRADLLTPAMNNTLDHSDRPFGQVVAPLGFHRRPISSERLSIGSGSVLARRAVLVSNRGEPFAMVQETYSAALLRAP